MTKFFEGPEHVVDMAMSELYPQFMHHGAADGVTGSCHRYIASEHFHLLVDCGLFQGRDAPNAGIQGQQIDFDLSCVSAIIVTHVHIDHVGRLPYLLSAGFKGSILCSAPSAKLLPLVIEDAFKIGFTRDKRLVTQFLKQVQSRLMPLAYNKWYPLRNEPCLQLKMRLQRAGHILGSAYVELDLKQREAEGEKWQTHRTVFSGDLGAPHAPLLPAPKSPFKADTLIIESTYGNRVHEDRRERRLRLKALVEKALADGGSVLIPAFSIGRTQELLYEFESIINSLQTSCGSEITIIVDSPLAARFTAAYRELKTYWDQEALQRVHSGRHPLNFESLLTIDSHDDHLRVVRYLAETRKPAIVIAASGMAAGGRIVNYLKAMLGDARHNVLFVGFQVPGTPGFEILNSSTRRRSLAREGVYGAHGFSRASPLPHHDSATGDVVGSVELEGEQFDVRAAVEMVGGYSAHADRENLLTFIRGMRYWPQQVRVVHGNDEGRAALRAAIETMAKQRGKQIEVVLPERSVAISA